MMVVMMVKFGKADGRNKGYCDQQQQHLLHELPSFSSPSYYLNAEACQWAHSYH
jgi:hypothetical protein